MRREIAWRLDLGDVPEVALDQWRLDIGGHVHNPVTLSWTDFLALPQADGLVYLGVLVKQPERQVLLRDGEGVHVLREGETIRGLEVRRISAEGVLLGNATSEVKLPAPVDRTGSIEFRRME